MGLLRVKKLDIDAGNIYIVVLNENTMKKYNLHPLDRIDVIKGRRRLTCIINVSNKIVGNGEIGLYECVAEKLGVVTGDEVDIELQMEPKSVKYIKEKLEGKTLSYREIKEIVVDTVNRDLTDVELAAFVTGLEINGMTMDEAEYLSRAMVETSKTLNFGKKVYDKHSLGGIPGKKETLLIVPIVASAGLIIPKTSSRAISSPAGTADIVETIADVEFTLEEIKRIVKKCNGCMVWGGAVDLAPADDIFVKIEYPLKIDPLFLPSVMSKKKAVNAKHVVIDIPTGRGAKIKTFMEANKIAGDFIELGRRLGMEVRCAITQGEQPVGHAVGPALEAKEALETLMGKGPESLIEKALGLASIIFEMAKKKNPRKLAEKILKSRKAEKKFRQIIGAQGGNPKLKPKDIPIGEHRFDVKSERKGRVFWIRNDQIIELARRLGAPKDKGAGLILHKKVGYPVRKGEVLFTLYAENEKRLDYALSFLNHAEPVKVREKISQEMIIDVIPSRKHLYKGKFIMER